MPDASPTVMELAAQIVSAYVSNHVIADLDVPRLTVEIAAVMGGNPAEGALVNLSTPAVLIPAVPIKKSVYPMYIVCLEDGKKLKMLKPHLKAAYGMTLEQYRERWELPAHYPMVAPEYAEMRSRFAKEIGLGQKRKKVVVSY